LSAAVQFAATSDCDTIICFLNQHCYSTNVLVTSVLLFELLESVADGD